MLERLSGVYAITSSAGWVYIGSSGNCRCRWSQHTGQLRNGAHAYQKVFEKDFKSGKLVFSMLEKCNVGLRRKEQKWILKLTKCINKYSADQRLRYEALCKKLNIPLPKIGPRKKYKSGAEISPLARLNENQVREARAQYKSKLKTSKEIAAKLGISITAASFMLNRKTYKYVK